MRENECKSLKCASLIRILSIVALLCTVFNCVSYFLVYEQRYDVTNTIPTVEHEITSGEDEPVILSSVLPFEYKESYELVVNFPNLEAIISLLAALLSALLFFVCAFKYYGQSKSKIFIAIIFLISMVPILKTIIVSIFYRYTYGEALLRLIGIYNYSTETYILGVLKLFCMYLRH